MKFRLLPLALFAMLFVFVACSDDDDDNGPVTPNNNITISNIIPISGPIGTDVRLRGTNCGTVASELTITFGGVSVTPESLTDTEMVIRVPAELPIGATTIVVKRGDGKAVTVQFTVEDPIVGEWTSEGQNQLTRS